MAELWIKIEKSTPDKAEVFEIAALLNIDPDEVVGKLVRVWCWVDSNSSNGHIKSVTSVLLDRVTNCVGFSDALKTVGWLEDNLIPNFDRHLGESAKKRAKDAERKRKSRNTSVECPEKDVTQSGLDKIREYKRREDKPPTKPAAKFSEWDMNFSIWALDAINAVIPNFKKPNLEQWAKQCRLMREIDNRAPNEMGELWAWVRKDNFWNANCQGMKKFREKFDQLITKSRAPTTKQGGIDDLLNDDDFFDKEFGSGQFNQQRTEGNNGQLPSLEKLSQQQPGAVHESVQIGVDQGDDGIPC